jgi:hypothetical protein
MSDLIQFLNDALLDPGLRGQFVAQSKNPHNTDDDLSQWLIDKGYNITPEDCIRLRAIDRDNENVNRGAPLRPLY